MKKINLQQKVEMNQLNPLLLHLVLKHLHQRNQLKLVKLLMKQLLPHR